MSTHQIKSIINDFVNHIEDENQLKACFKAVTTIVKDNNQPITKAIEPRINKKNILTQRRKGIEPITRALKRKNNVKTHDLSLILLANDLFKGSESLSEAGEIAFDKAFKKSLKKEPSLPNRL